jgi:hypothetical protein
MWWHTVTHWRGSEGKTGEWSGQPVPFTLPRNMVCPALPPLMRTPRLPVVDWTDALADLNGLVRFSERWNLLSARVPSHFKSSLPSHLPFTLHLHETGNKQMTTLFVLAVIPYLFCAVPKANGPHQTIYCLPVASTLTTTSAAIAFHCNYSPLSLCFLLRL